MLPKTSNPVHHHNLHKHSTKNQHQQILEPNRLNRLHNKHADLIETKSASKNKRCYIIGITISILLGVILLIGIGLVLYFYLTSHSSRSSTTKAPNLNVFYNLSINETCGAQMIKPDLNLARIINGYEAVAHSWPWMASIGYFGPKTNYSHVCGGTLIAPNYVLTAAHCVYKTTIFSLVGNPIVGSAYYGSIEKMGRIFLGLHDRLTDITSSNTFFIKRIISHESYNEDTLDNDIALIELATNATLSSNIELICLNFNLTMQSGQLIYAIGWGKDIMSSSNNYNAYPSNLLQTKFQILQPSACSEYDIDINKQLCAGTYTTNSTLPKDTCSGDSGGPIMAQNKNNLWLIVGIVSYGHTSCDGLGVYTDVKYYYDWIMTNIYS